jgi:hypothetical protein
VAKTGSLWKFGFCRDMSLDLGVLALTNKKESGENGIEVGE